MCMYVHLHFLHRLLDYDLRFKVDRLGTQSFKYNPIEDLLEKCKQISQLLVFQHISICICIYSCDIHFLKCVLF